MAFALNRVMLAGNLTRDPQLRSISSDKAVADFGLAINRKYKGNDGQLKEDVTFVDVEAWGRTAELVGQYLTKGRPCYIEGRLKFESWQDKDGQKRSKLKVVADSVQFLDSRPAGERNDGAGQESSGGHSTASSPSANAAMGAASPASSGPPVGDDEPPF